MGMKFISNCLSRRYLRSFQVIGDWDGFHASEQDLNVCLDNKKNSTTPSFIIKKTEPQVPVKKISEPWPHITNRPDQPPTLQQHPSRRVARKNRNLRAGEAQRGNYFGATPENDPCGDRTWAGCLATPRPTSRA
jgi:hypothetical protein